MSKLSMEGLKVYTKEQKDALLRHYERHFGYCLGEHCLLVEAEFFQQRMQTSIVLALFSKTQQPFLTLCTIGLGLDLAHELCVRVIASPQRSYSIQEILSSNAPEVICFFKTIKQILEHKVLPYRLKKQQSNTQESFKTLESKSLLKPQDQNLVNKITLDEEITKLEQSIAKFMAEDDQSYRQKIYRGYMEQFCEPIKLDQDLIQAQLVNCSNDKYFAFLPAIAGISGATLLFPHDKLDQLDTLYFVLDTSKEQELLSLLDEDFERFVTVVHSLERVLILQVQPLFANEFAIVRQMEKSFSKDLCELIYSLNQGYQLVRKSLASIEARHCNNYLPCYLAENYVVDRLQYHTINLDRYNLSLFLDGRSCSQHMAMFLLFAIEHKLCHSLFQAYLSKALANLSLVPESTASDASEVSDAIETSAASSAQQSTIEEKLAFAQSIVMRLLKGYMPLALFSENVIEFLRTYYHDQDIFAPRFMSDVENYTFDILQESYCSLEHKSKDYLFVPFDAQYYQHFTLVLAKRYQNFVEKQALAQKCANLELKKFYSFTDDNLALLDATKDLLSCCHVYLRYQTWGFKNKHDLLAHFVNLEREWNFNNLLEEADVRPRVFYKKAERALKCFIIQPSLALLKSIFLNLCIDKEFVYPFEERADYVDFDESNPYFDEKLLEKTLKLKLNSLKEQSSLFIFREFVHAQIEDLKSKQLLDKAYHYLLDLPDFSSLERFNCPNQDSVVLFKAKQQAQGSYRSLFKLEERLQELSLWQKLKFNENQKKLEGEALQIFSASLEHRYEFLALLGEKTGSLPNRLVLFTTAKYFEEHYQAALIAISDSVLEFIVPKGFSSLKWQEQIALEHFAFCPNLAKQYAGNLQEYQKFLASSEVWTFDFA